MRGDILNSKLESNKKYWKKIKNQTIQFRSKEISYRDTEKLVHRHIALDKPVHGRQAAYMDIFVQPFDTRSNTAVFEYAFVLAELFSAI